jgi:hypothetical protein
MPQPTPQPGRPSGTPLGRPGGMPQRPTAPPLPQKEQFAFDRIHREYLMPAELMNEFKRLPSNYPGKTYSNAEKIKLAQELAKDAGGYITKKNLPFLRKKLALGSRYGSDESKKAEYRRRLQMIQKIFGNQ